MSRPRQSDIAREAGVSQATVSLVVNGRAGIDIQIAPETRRRVTDAIERLGYVVDPVARRLAGGQNRLLGIYTFESIFPLDQRDFYYPFLVGVEQEAEAKGYDLILFTSATGREGTRHIYGQGENRLRVADGCVLMGREATKIELERLVHEDFPFVFIGRREVHGGDLSYVGADYTEATAAVVAHIASFGHRRIGYMRSDRENEPSFDRDSGFRMGHERLGIPLDPSLIRRPGGRPFRPEDIEDLLRQGVTAIVAEDAGADHGFVDAVRSMGVRIPQDLSVALLTDPPVDDQLDLDWAGFHIPRSEMGRRAVALLVDFLSGWPSRTPHHVLLPCTFVPGSTVGPIR